MTGTPRALITRVRSLLEPRKETSNLLPHHLDHLLSFLCSSQLHKSSNLDHSYEQEKSIILECP